MVGCRTKADFQEYVHAWLVDRDYGHTNQMTEAGRCTHIGPGIRDTDPDTVTVTVRPVDDQLSLVTREDGSQFYVLTTAFEHAVKG